MSDIRDLIARNRAVLNRLEPHLGCVVCRGPLTDGVCSTCDSARPPAVPKPKCCGGRWNGASIVHTDDCPGETTR